MAAGNAYYANGEYAEAIRAYQSAQVAEPDRSEAYFNAANAYSQMGDFAAAIAAYRQTLKTSDENLLADAHYNLGNVYLQQSELVAAIRAYQKALLLRPDDADARHNLELAFYLLTSTPPAAAQFSHTLDGDDFTDELTVPSTPQADFGATVTAGESTQTNEMSVYQAVTPSLTVAEAEQILDAAQQSQLSYSLTQPVGTPSAVGSGKDW